MQEVSLYVKCICLYWYNKILKQESLFVVCVCGVGHWRGADDEPEGQSDPQSQTKPGLELDFDHHYTEGKNTHSVLNKNSFYV